MTCRTVKVSASISAVPVAVIGRYLENPLPVALGQTEIGDRIRAARRRAGLSQPELAIKIGMAPRGETISRYERGQERVPGYRLERIAEATNQPLSFFVGDEPELPVTEPSAPVEPYLQSYIAEIIRAGPEQIRAHRELLEGACKALRQASVATLAFVERAEAALSDALREM